MAHDAATYAGPVLRPSRLLPAAAVAIARAAVALSPFLLGALDRFGVDWTRLSEIVDGLRRRRDLRVLAPRHARGYVPQRVRPAVLAVRPRLPGRLGRRQPAWAALRRDRRRDVRPRGRRPPAGPG